MASRLVFSFFLLSSPPRLPYHYQYHYHYTYCYHHGDMGPWRLQKNLPRAETGLSSKSLRLRFSGFSLANWAKGPFVSTWTRRHANVNANRHAVRRN